MNNDGYNDIIAVTHYYDELITFGRILVFLNNNGTVNTSPVYNNGTLRYVYGVDAADFNKDGWNDLVVDNGQDSISLFLNNKSSGLFSTNPTEGFNYEIYPSPINIPPLVGKKIQALDLYNTGGLGIVYSGNVSAIPAFEFETIIRINATTTDANPAPPYLFKATFADDDTIRPRLILFNRGDRDFQKYKIYKNSPTTSYYWLLIDSTTASEYIDYNEIFTTGGGVTRPPDNCFYYVKVQDNSYKVSINSDTIGYPTIVCPTCPWVPDNISANNDLEIELPKKFSITNFPNPFNPSTKIYYTIPKEGNVKITVYNSLGQTVIELVNELKQPGAYIAEFNGNKFASGIYYYRIDSGDFTHVKKMILIK